MYKSLLQRCKAKIYLDCLKKLKKIPWNQTATQKNHPNIFLLCIFGAKTYTFNKGLIKLS